MVRLEPRRSEEGILDRTTRRRGVSMVVVVTQDHVTRRQPCRIPYRLYPSRHALVLFPSKSIPGWVTTILEGKSLSATCTSTPLVSVNANFGPRRLWMKKGLLCGGGIFVSELCQFSFGDGEVNLPFSCIPFLLCTTLVAAKSRRLS